MRRIAIALIGSFLWGGAALRAEVTSYMVVRLNDASYRYVVAQSGASEIANPDLRSNEVLVSVSESQLEKLREQPAVDYVYPASEELVRGIPVNGCAHSEPEQVGMYVMMGGGWTNGRKVATNLTYSFGFVPSSLGRERMSAAVQRALEEWSRYVQIKFTYTSNPDANRNLHFMFASGDHGDAYPFDGKGKMLAHTFYPAGVNPEPVAGDLHFDAEENWQNGVDPDFYSAVLHELGHALGLGHSNQPTAVMYPYYRSLDKLQTDDISAIRELYLAKQDAVESAPVVQATAADKAPPVLTIKTPGTTIYSTSAATIRISGTASDNTGVEKVTWTASGGRSGVATGTTSWTIADFALRLGDNAILIRAYDAAGNSSWRSVTITRR